MNAKRPLPRQTAVFRAIFSLLLGAWAAWLGLRSLRLDGENLMVWWCGAVAAVAAGQTAFYGFRAVRKPSAETDGPG